MKNYFIISLLCFVFINLMFSSLLRGNTQNIVLSANKQNDALSIKTTYGELKLIPYEFGVVRIQHIPENRISEPKNFAVIKEFSSAKYQLTDNKEEVILKTKNITVIVDKSSGELKFYNNENKLLLTENLPNISSSSDSIRPLSSFKISPKEALYGLGQFRDNALNLRNTTRELVQFNTQAAVPVIYSTNGWGILWNNPSRTVFNDDSAGMSFSSDWGCEIDYYLFVGNNLDELISSYRKLTGEAPMVPYWTLGYHQSRNKYATQDELLSISQQMADEKVQMSSIFIDYFYWGKYGTGSHKFDESLFPDVKGMLDKLHNTYKTNAVITIWPTFRKGIPNYDEFDQKGLLLNGAKALDGTIYDVFSPVAREIYWQQALPLVKQGLDGWFLDGPEPDQINSFLKTTTYEGPAPKVRNLYPLLHSENFYNNIIKDFPNKRPYLLTRCAWAAQQRTGAAVWSGDIPTTFDELRKQVTAGLNFVATGIPYWTTDIGGYSGGDPSDEAYREVFTRWFQYGTFCPVFRCHGRRYPGDTKAPNELWAYGKEVQQICTDYINLRYSLMPYIYSLTGDVTHKDYTPMRLLAFDFPNDENVLDCKDEFMYGPSLLICPVLDASTTKREVYLPRGTNWIDFWTNQQYEGGQKIMADAAKNRIPIYVKGGSIIPSFTDSNKENTWNDPINLYIYKGADGQFELYEDDGKSFDYEKGDYSYIPFIWNDSKNELTIDKLRGKYNKNMKDFRITLVDKGRKSEAEKKVSYNGKKLVVKL